MAEFTEGWKSTLWPSFPEGDRTATINPSLPPSRVRRIETGILNPAVQFAIKLGLDDRQILHFVTFVF